jgi:hypothetical protein
MRCNKKKLFGKKSDNNCLKPSLSFSNNFQSKKPSIAHFLRGAIINELLQNKKLLYSIKRISAATFL